MNDIPRTLAQLSAEWLNEQFAAAGSASGRVAEMHLESMDGFVGALGEVGIVRVRWEGDPAEVEPTAFVAKCPLDDDIARLYNSVMGSYARESGFYRDLAPLISDEVGMRIPGCLINRFDPETGAAFLLLEYMQAESKGDILEGCDVETMRRLVGDLARMHGRFWMDDRLSSLDWIYDWQVESLKLGIEMVQQAWAALAQAEPDRYPPDVADVLERTWVNDTEHFLDLYAQRPWTLTHIDYELDNILHGAEGPIVVDWQSVMRSHPGVDLAWLLAASHNDETLAAEPELLDHYRAELAAAGGPTWSAEDLEVELAWGVLYPAACQPVPYLQNVDAYGPHAERMHRRFEKFLVGAIEAAARWNLVEHLGPHVRR